MRPCNVNEHLQASVFTQLCKLYGSFLNYILVLLWKNAEITIHKLVFVIITP